MTACNIKNILNAKCLHIYELYLTGFFAKLGNEMKLGMLAKPQRLNSAI